jgi:hypothetical protein
VTALGNKLTELAQHREGIATALATCTEWSIWTQKVLQPRNEREDVQHWACGRPSATEATDRNIPLADGMMDVRAHGSVLLPDTAALHPRLPAGTLT